MECGVCFELIRNNELGGVKTCVTGKHVFHKECLRRWTRGRGSRRGGCPICRGDVERNLSSEESALSGMEEWYPLSSNQSESSSDWLGSDYVDSDAERLYMLEREQIANMSYNLRNRDINVGMDADVLADELLRPDQISSSSVVIDPIDDPIRVLRSRPIGRQIGGVIDLTNSGSESSTETATVTESSDGSSVIIERVSRVVVPRARLGLGSGVNTSQWVRGEEGGLAIFRRLRENGLIDLMHSRNRRNDESEEESKIETEWRTHK